MHHLMQLSLRMDPSMQAAATQLNANSYGTHGLAEKWRFSKSLSSRFRNYGDQGRLYARVSRIWTGGTCRFSKTMSKPHLCTQISKSDVSPPLQPDCPGAWLNLILSCLSSNWMNRHVVWLDLQDFASVLCHSNHGQCFASCLRLYCVSLQDEPHWHPRELSSTRWSCMDPVLRWLSVGTYVLHIIVISVRPMLKIVVKFYTSCGFLNGWTRLNKPEGSNPRIQIVINIWKTWLSPPHVVHFLTTWGQWPTTGTWAHGSHDQCDHIWIHMTWFSLIYR